MQSNISSTPSSEKVLFNDYNIALSMAMALILPLLLPKIRAFAQNEIHNEKGNTSHHKLKQVLYEMSGVHLMALTEDEIESKWGSNRQSLSFMSPTLAYCL